MPEISVVICSLNGADGVDRCLHELSRQTVADDIEVIVVDDGSTDDTSAVALRHGVELVRHHVNLGLSAARNSGIRAATAPIVAFLDDDTVPEPDWAERLLECHGDDVVGAGGVVVPTSGASIVGRYLERHNPLEPLEIELAQSEALPYRLRLYLKRQWSDEAPRGLRDVHALVGANMSFPRDALLEIGMFDARFRFGHEELDLCRRLCLANPGKRFVVQPSARVVHYFEPSLRDTLRRARSYGRGSARMLRKWPSSRPTIFPFPFAVAALALAGLRRPSALLAALLAPQLMFPAGLRRALKRRDPEALVDAYVQLAQEAAGNAGFFQGLWEFRDFQPHMADEEAAVAIEREPA